MGSMNRRDFLAATGSAALAYTLAKPAVSQTVAGQAPTSNGRVKLEPFDYEHVTLRESRWKQQFDLCKSFYLGVSDDDILCGYRRAAGQAAPGRPLGGWCATNSNTVFGQWLQGLTRMARATGDAAPREKAIVLVKEWGKTLPADGNAGMGHYPFEKLVGGLVDMKLYGGFDEALGLLERVVKFAEGSLNRDRVPAAPRPWILHSGRTLEWYTLGENLHRAHQLTGDAKYREFAEVWHYTPYWEKFAASAEGKDVWGVHAYSHVNSLSSAAMAYAVTGEEQYLRAMKNCYDFMQATQCYATGGYGPAERLMPPHSGNLGKSLELHQNSFEAPCCSWAAFKLARYLMTFTGEARYGDWIERLLYNGVGAALPITENGKNFYYADFRLAGGYKTYARSTYTCCAGTYFQAVTEYVNLIYFKDASALYVNLYLPSEVKWQRPEGEVTVMQETGFPESEGVTLTLKMPRAMRFGLRLRVPGWAEGFGAIVNGQAEGGFKASPGNWLGLDREWKDGDKVEIRLPLRFRYQAIDTKHPDRVAVLRGPAVYVQDATAHEPHYAVPERDEELNRLLIADPRGPNYSLRLEGRNGEDVTSSAASQAGTNRRGGAATAPAYTVAGAKFMPFYAVQEVNAYRMYFDRKEGPVYLW